MLSHSPLNSVGSPGPVRMSINNPNQSRNQMHSPAPQIQNGNYAMQMNSNYNNNPQGPGGNMGRGPPMHPDDMLGSGFAGNFGPPAQQQQQQQGMQHSMPPQPNQFNPMQGGMMNMNPHGNMMSPHQQPQGPGQQQQQHMMMPGHGQPGPGQNMMPMYTQPPSGMISPHPQPNNNPNAMMPQYPQSVMSPHPQQGAGVNGPPGGGQPHHQQGPHGMMQHPQSRVMSPHQGQPNGPPGMHHHGPPSMQNNMIPPHMQPNNGPGMMPPGGRMMPQHMHPAMQHQMQSQPNISSPHPHAGMMSPHGPPPPGMMPHHVGQPGMPPHAMMGPPPGPPPPPGNNVGKIYPSNQPMIFNSQNPNAPPIHPCGVCHREVQGDSEDGILCESGCNFWFHRMCINMSAEAYNMLKSEIFVEWACDNCIRNKNIPPVKLRS
jgi:hypothetical protein